VSVSSRADKGNSRKLAVARWPSDAQGSVATLTVHRVGEHRRAFRNMCLRCADKLSLLGRRALAKHARCSVDK
jgi:hypothetical protein